MMQDNSFANFNESHIEEAVLSILEGIGYTRAHGPDLAPGEPDGERTSYADTLLLPRLRAALERINAGLPPGVLEEAIKTVQNVPFASGSLEENNRRFHELLVEGVAVARPAEAGHTAYERVRLLDFSDAANNDWLVLNQLTVIENKKNRRADVVIYVNGMPLGLIELKNAGDEKATTKGAWQQLQTYKADIPALLAFNEALVISDGLEARVGTLTAPFERFAPWRTEDGESLAPPGTPEMETLLRGVFQPARFLDLIESFIVWEVERGGAVKKMAGYHQMHAVNRALAFTLQAAGEGGDQRAGVVWHTQGSGKSLSMVFYAAKVTRALDNPTLVVLTDRQDLDGQLFKTFAGCASLLRQTPSQAETRENLRQLLQVTSGGVVFTTIQKFMPTVKGERYPELSPRRNIVVIADEAHRSQYNYAARFLQDRDEAEAYISYGFAQHMRDALPNASFIGFTGTPIEASDRSTPKVFGDYIDVYDLQQAVEDKATVPIFYEARMAKIQLEESERPRLDEEFEEVTEGEEAETKSRALSKWTRTEALVGAEKRLAQLAADIVEHFEARRDAMGALASPDATPEEIESERGKGMIVCMSRRICAELYDAIIKLRPEWDDTDDEKGFLKVVMTGSATDPANFQPHIRSKSRRDALADNFKDPLHPVKLVIVRDMWLTGFDAPCLHTMYADKPMQGHGLMQAIARVNRVFKEKPGGLIVDYLGLANHLKRALNDYTEGDREQMQLEPEVLMAEMQKRLEVVRALMHGFDYSGLVTVAPHERLRLIAGAMNHVLPEAKRFKDGVVALTKAWSLAVPHEAALAIREELGFFQVVRAGLVKMSPENGGKSSDDLDVALRQMVSKAVAPVGIVEIFQAAGLRAPDISILSDEFLEEVKELPQRNLAVEMLRRLLSDQIRSRSKSNVVQARLFSEQLDKAILRYQNRSIEAGAIIQELVDMAKDLRAAARRGEELGLSDDELAFYDALEANDSAVQVLGDDTLKSIARELVTIIKSNVSIDWAQKDSVRAKLRTIVKRLLRKYGYPPNKQEKATQTVLEQAEQLSQNWVEI